MKPALMSDLLVTLGFDQTVIDDLLLEPKDPRAL